MKIRIIVQVSRKTMKSIRHSIYSNVLAYVNLKIPVYYMYMMSKVTDWIYCT